MARRPVRTEEQREEFIPNFLPFVTPITIPAAGICEDPAINLCINSTWMPIIRGLFQVLDQPDVWDTEDDDEIFAVRQQIKELMAMGDCLCGYGATDAVIRLSVDLTLHNQYVKIFNDDGLDGVAPDRPDTAFDEDAGDTGDEIRRRELALCGAVTDYVTSVVEKGIFNAFIPDAVTLLTSGAISFLVGPLGGLVYRFASEVFEAIINKVANDPGLIEDVACCMLNGLEGKAITEANFEAALDDCGFGPVSDQAFISDAVKTGLDDTGNFLSFVAILGGYMDVVDILDVCPCDTGADCVDFTIDEQGFSPDIRPGPVLGALYVAGVGFDNPVAASINHRISIKHLFDEDIAFTSVTIKTVNTLSDTIRFSFELFDEFGTSLEQDFIDIDPPVQEHTFNFSEVTGVRDINVRAIKPSNQLNFPGHIVEVCVVATPSPFAQ